MNHVSMSIKQNRREGEGILTEKEGSCLREVSLPAEELQVRRPRGRNVPAGLQKSRDGERRAGKSSEETRVRAGRPRRPEPALSNFQRGA